MHKGVVESVYYIQYGYVCPAPAPLLGEHLLHKINFNKNIRIHIDEEISEIQTAGVGDHGSVSVCVCCCRLQMA